MTLYYDAVPQCRRNLFDSTDKISRMQQQIDRGDLVAVISHGDYWWIDKGVYQILRHFTFPEHDPRIGLCNDGTFLATIPVEIERDEYALARFRFPRMLDEISEMIVLGK